MSEEHAGCHHDQVPDVATLIRATVHPDRDKVTDTAIF
jgi:hypothetical protein